MDAIDMFAKLGYTEYDSSENAEYYYNPKTGMTIEIRNYIDEFVKFDKENKRRGINFYELLAITQEYKERGFDV